MNVPKLHHFFHHDLMCIFFCRGLLVHDSGECVIWRRDTRGLSVATVLLRHRRRLTYLHVGRLKIRLQVLGLSLQDQLAKAISRQSLHEYEVLCLVLCCFTKLVLLKPVPRLQGLLSINLLLVLEYFLAPFRSFAL